MKLERYPLKMRPAYKDSLWGGDTLKRKFGKDSGLAVTAESWELSTQSAGLSIIANGAYADMTFAQYAGQFPEAVSPDFKAGEKFPILVKFLDVEKPISIQVHPSDENAGPGEEGKAEAWYIGSANPGARIYYGLKEQITKEELREHAANGTMEQVVNQVPVRPGQVWYNHPGIVHSLEGGALVAEVQQNSNTTYRVYDFNRKDASGNLRELHLEKALDVIDYAPQQGDENAVLSKKAEGNALAPLFVCQHFKMERLDVQDRIDLCCGDQSFYCLLFLEGAGSIIHAGQKFDFTAGDCYFIPAGLGEYRVEGACMALAAHI